MPPRTRACAAWRRTPSHRGAWPCCVNTSRRSPTACSTRRGGQATPTTLIGTGVLTRLRHPDRSARLRDDLSLIPSAVEELLRFEPRSQPTARMAPDDVELGGRRIKKRQAVIAVMAAG